MIGFRNYNYIKNIRRLFDLVHSKKYLKFYNKNRLPIKNKSKFFKDFTYKKTKRVPVRFIKNSSKYTFNSKLRIQNINSIFFLKKTVKGLSYFKLNNNYSINSCCINNFNLEDFFFNFDNTIYYDNVIIKKNINNLILLRI